MEPVLNKRFLAGDRFHLRNFGFMMRENKVDGPTMDVVLRTKFGLGNGRIFYMPTWPAIAETRWPGRFSFFLEFPKAEITWILFLRVLIYTRYGVTRLESAPSREFAIIPKPFRIKVIPVRNFVG